MPPDSHFGPLPELGATDIRVVYTSQGNASEPGWALASLRINGRAALAARWNDEDIYGEIGRGASTWFVLPDHIAKLVMRNLPDQVASDTLPVPNARVRLSPVPKRYWMGRAMAAQDHVWIVTERNLEQRRLTLSNLSTGQVLRLWPEQIVSYRPDPAPARDSVGVGQLQLAVQVTSEDGHLSMRPI